MSRSSTRNSAARKSASAKSSGGDRTPSASSRSRTKEVDRLFDSYANSSLGMIDPEGIEALCSDVGVDHTDVRILMLAWKMEAEKQGYFTQDEWRRGLKALRVGSLNKLKKALLELEREVNNHPSNFASFYSYAFQSCLTEERQKTVDIESVCVLLDLVLGFRFRPQVDLYIEYLKIQKDYLTITMDQWVGFFRFCNEISFPDLQNYDSNLAWPLIIDNFVEWLIEKQS
ncbi:uncharacterized protein LOC131158380 [Malania oleifera]|uniref:uncharacterized protein LOC131158380 n=1 Tax=Malania oleifera TaxID=397392 RepID=UPI0025AE4AE6|nr:uncharacterized protein LOC131158380 [Malania oleifera]